jgi:hypothetical protein
MELLNNEDNFTSIDYISHNYIPNISLKLREAIPFYVLKR